MEVTSFLHQNHVDLFFLDIQMPKLSGIELLKVLKAPPAVIITTAHREYALEGYNIDVVDYLLKPITFDRFVSAVERYYARNKTRHSNQSILISPSTENFLLLKSGATIHQINTNAVLYIESLKDYIKIHFEDNRINILKYKIGQLENELSTNFIRVNKSFIINTNKVTVFNNSQIEIGNVSIPVGFNYKLAIKKILNK